MSYKLLKFSVSFAKNLALCQFLPSGELSLHVYHQLAGNPAEFGQNIQSFWQLSWILNHSPSVTPHSPGPHSWPALPLQTCAWFTPMFSKLSGLRVPRYSQQNAYFPTPTCSVLVNLSYQEPTQPCVSVCQEETGHWTVLSSTHPYTFWSKLLLSALLWGQYHMDLDRSYLLWNWH